MPKATLEFDLDDIHEKYHHARVVSATDAYLVMLEFESIMRDFDKYQDDKPLLPSKVREIFRGVQEKHNINMDNLE